MSSTLAHQPTMPPAPFRAVCLLQNTRAVPAQGLPSVWGKLSSGAGFSFLLQVPVYFPQFLLGVSRLEG